MIVSLATRPLEEITRTPLLVGMRSVLTSRDLHPRRQEGIHDSRKTEKECTCVGNHEHCTVESFGSGTEGLSCESCPLLEDGEESVLPRNVNETSVVRIGQTSETNE